MDRGLRTLISFEFSKTISPRAQAFQKLDTHYIESRDGVAMEGFICRLLVSRKDHGQNQETKLLANYID